VPPEEFFTGTTQAGRTLVLFYEHTRFDTFIDDTGETFDNPAETKVTATLDGAPIDVEAVSWSSDGTATVRSDLGTFTATSTDYAEDHSEALRRYLEHRPSEGYEVAIVDKSQVDDEASYTVTIRCSTRSRSRSAGTSGRRSRSARRCRRSSSGSRTRARRRCARMSLSTALAPSSSCRATRISPDWSEPIPRR
jgi:hypothetical protein